MDYSIQFNKEDVGTNIQQVNTSHRYMYPYVVVVV